MTILYTCTQFRVTHVLFCASIAVVWKETTFQWPGPPGIEVEKAVAVETKLGVASAGAHTEVASSAPREKAVAGSTESPASCSFSAVAAAAVARSSRDEKVPLLHHHRMHKAFLGIGWVYLEQRLRSRHEMPRAVSPTASSARMHYFCNCTGTGAAREHGILKGRGGHFWTGRRR